MDMLDPINTSQDDDTKVILEHAITIEEHSLGSDDMDDPHVEHLSPQTLLETPDDDVQYSFRALEGSTVTYGSLKVEDDSVPQLLATPTFTSTSVPQLVTSNINGHLYVIGNASDVFVTHQTTGTRPIVPRTTVLETPVVPIANNKKVKRDERRRATHNEVERRRRDKINNWINKLAKIIPETTGEMKSNGHYDGQSKGGILAKACEYIMELRTSQRLLEETEAECKRLQDALEDTKRQNASLDLENKTLRELLQQHSVQLLDEAS